MDGQGDENAGHEEKRRPGLAGPADESGNEQCSLDEDGIDFGAG